MEKDQQFSLVEGSFDALHALELLQDLFSSKINFHNKEAFGTQLKGHQDISHIKIRVEELKQARQNVAKLVKYAHTRDLSLNIKCDINVQLIEK